MTIDPKYLILRKNLAAQNENDFTKLNAKFNAELGFPSQSGTNYTFEKMLQPAGGAKRGVMVPTTEAQSLLSPIERISLMSPVNWSQTPYASPISTRPDDFEIEFEDDFDGSSLDTTKWTPSVAWYSPLVGDFGNNRTVPTWQRDLMADFGITYPTAEIGWKEPGSTYNYFNDELQCYEDGQITVADGKLKLRCQHVSTHPTNTSPRIQKDKNGNNVSLNWVSGWVSTLKTYRMVYGYIEWYAKFADGRAYWPALWTLPAGLYGTEIDPFEAVFGNGRQNRSEHTHHYRVGNDHRDQTAQKVTVNDYHVFTDGQAFTTAFHKIGAYITPYSISHYVDDKLVYEIDYGIVHEPYGFVNPSMIIMNFAIGGAYPNALGISVDGTTPLDATMEVDYCRVWRLKPGELYFPELGF